MDYPVTVHANREVITLRCGPHAVSDYCYTVGGGDMPEIAGRGDSAALSSLPTELAEVVYPNDCDHYADGTPLPGCPGPDRRRLASLAHGAMVKWELAGRPLTPESPPDRYPSGSTHPLRPDEG